MRKTSGFSTDVMARQLRMWRAGADLSQEQLAKMSGVSVASIQKYEDGLTVPSFERAYALAMALGCTVNDLCGIEA